ncbi:MAG: DNA polymerase Y family protein [Verrucomicrobiota bacterium]
MFAAIFIPDFFLQAALRQSPELFSRPVALLDPELKWVCQMTSPARDAGICEGLTSTQALARCSTILIRSRSSTQEVSASEVLLECAYAFSPNIESTAPGICTLDLKGLSIAKTPKTSGQDWAEKILTQLAGLNLRAQIGVAENPDLALHAAKIARPFFAVEDSREFLAALPVESIEPPADLLDILRRWGIRTVGEFVALQKDKLVERMGADAIELFDRATAHTFRPLVLVRPREIFEESVEFEHEIETLQPLLFILRRFIEQLARRLELFYFVASEIQLRLILNSGEQLEHHFRVPSPTRNIETLFRMLQTHLETIQTDSPIVALHLSAKPGRSSHFQFGLFETALRDPNHFYETLAQLTSVVGQNRVGTPVLSDTFRPDTFQMAPVNFETDRSVDSENSSAPRAMGLPLRRFRPPLPATVELRANQPALLRSEKFIGPIAKANGPFRLSGNWWEEKQLWSRDEWDVETSGGELYRLSLQNGHWLLEGAYD